MKRFMYVLALVSLFLFPFNSRPVRAITPPEPLPNGYRDSRFPLDHFITDETPPMSTLIPFDLTQTTPRTAYQSLLTHLYAGERTHWAAAPFEAGVLGSFDPGTFILPAAELSGDYTYYHVTDRPVITRAYRLRPAAVAVMRSTVTIPMELDDGYVMAGWELAEIRQVLDGYLMGAVPYAVLTEAEIAAHLLDYDLLIIPAFRNESADAVLARLTDTGALEAIQAFVNAGGTLYAQGSGLEIAEQAGVLPMNTVALEQPLVVVGEEYANNQGVLEVLQPASPLAYSWLGESLYILNDPYLYPDETITVIANLTNVDTGEGIGTAPAIIHRPVGRGQVIGVVGHPTDARRRNELPIFMDALLTALAGRVDFYGDAIQTFNPDYPAHEFPAYEVVPVNAELHVENLWDKILYSTSVTETVSPGYVVLETSVTPTYTTLTTTVAGATIITWDLGDLAPRAQLNLSYQAETDPTTLAAGIGTFSRGELGYLDLPAEMETVFLPTHGTPIQVEHRPFVLTARMAANLWGDRGLEADRHYGIPARGVHLDITLPIENKEETLGRNVQVSDWVYLMVPFVDYENQHIILNANDGETIWMLNEPYLWNGAYPAPAPPPVQQTMQIGAPTYTLDDWQGARCIFTSTYGIHTDPPPLRASTTITDYGSFITIPAGYEDVITVTADNELLLPCLQLTWDLDDFPGYWYAEPAVRLGVHSRELFGREVRFHGTPRENTVVMPHAAGSVYVMAGSATVPFREHLDAATPYHAAAPTSSVLIWQDVWLRPHTTSLRAIFYDVWNWDSCATCNPAEQHAGVCVTYGLFADLDGDGVYSDPVTEIPTRLAETRLQMLLKTYSATSGDYDYVIPDGQNLIEFPIFNGLGIQVCPAAGTWEDSYRSLGPGYSELITVSEQAAHDYLYLQQTIPPGSAETVAISATIFTYDFNREGQFKIHNGARLIYRQMHAGPNSYEIYDSHPHVPEGWSSDGAITKHAGPTAISIYNDTLFFIYDIWDRYDARPYDRFYDPYIKSWGYEDLVWTTYVGGSEDKLLFHSTVGPAGRTRVRVSLDNNTGLTLTNIVIGFDLPTGITLTKLYTDPDTAPAPIWPELAFLNRTTVADARRGVWYFDLTVNEIANDLWGQVIEIPVNVSADNLPAGYAAPPIRLGLKRASDPQPEYFSAPAHSLVFTDIVPAGIEIQAIAWLTDTATRSAFVAAMDHDAGHPLVDTASEIFAALPVTFSFTQTTEGLLTIDLPATLQHLPSANDKLTLVGQVQLARAHHGPNVVNEGATMSYTDPVGLSWTEHSRSVTVEAHGAALWVNYYCDGGWGESEEPGTAGVMSYEGECIIPDYGASEIVIEGTVYNAGDAIAQDSVFSQTLPYGVIPVESEPMWDEMFTDASGTHIVWPLGDLAPGAWREIYIVLFVDPDMGEWEGEGRLTRSSQNRRLQGIDHSDGAFFDTYSQQNVSAQIGGALWLNTYNVSRLHQVYLPIVTRNFNPPVTIPAQVGLEIPVRDAAYPGEVFYTETIQLPANLRADGTYYLSSQPDTVAPIMVDDELALLVGDVEVFTYRFSADGNPPAPPVSATVAIPTAVMAQLAGQTVTIEYRDIYGSLIEATAIWWIWVP